MAVIGGKERSGGGGSAVVGAAAGIGPVVRRHAESWIEPGALGSRFPEYRPTLRDEPYASAAHAALAAAPMEGWLIDLGIEGWLRKDDALKLYELAFRSVGDILEIGCAHGLSTSIMAGALRDAGRPGRILSVDLHEGRMADARRTVAERGVAERVEFRLGDATEVCRELAAGGSKFGFAFVDHSHAYGPVREVLATMPALLTEGGFCLVHDYNDARNDDPANRRYGVRQAVEEALSAPTFSFCGVYGCTVLYRKDGDGDGGEANAGAGAAR